MKPTGRWEDGFGWDEKNKYLPRDDSFIWQIACAELCGWGHYRMIGRSYIHKDEADFEAWLKWAAAHRTRLRQDCRPERTEERIFSSSRTGICMRQPRMAQPPRAELSCANTSSPKITRSSASSSCSPALIFLLVGGALALLVRMQLGWPHAEIPILRRLVSRTTAAAHVARVLQHALQHARLGDDLLRHHPVPDRGVRQLPDSAA